MIDIGIVEKKIPQFPHFFGMDRAGFYLRCRAHISPQFIN